MDQVWKPVEVILPGPPAAFPTTPWAPGHSGSLRRATTARGRPIGRRRMRARSGGGAVVSGWRRSGIRFGGYERALMHYAILWAPYGEPPPDETLPIFGILSYELPERIREIALQDQARRVIVCGGEVPASALGIQRFDGSLPSRPDNVQRFPD